MFVLYFFFLYYTLRAIYPIKSYYSLRSYHSFRKETQSYYQLPSESPHIAKSIEKISFSQFVLLTDFSNPNETIGEFLSHVTFLSVYTTMIGVPDKRPNIRMNAKFQSDGDIRVCRMREWERTVGNFRNGMARPLRRYFKVTSSYIWIDFEILGAFFGLWNSNVTFGLVWNLQ